MPTRRRSRIIAFQILYSMAYNPQDVEEAARRYCLLEPDRKRGLPPFALHLARTAHDHQWELDVLINRNLQNWRPERLTLPDRLLLRLACAEFFHFEEIPAKVTLDEYIELARQFSDDGAPAFVNGVLDAVLKSSTLPATKATEVVPRSRRRGHALPAQQGAPPASPPQENAGPAELVPPADAPAGPPSDSDAPSV